jgi:hypothetical protein
MEGPDRGITAPTAQGSAKNATMLRRRRSCEPE